MAGAGAGARYSVGTFRILCVGGCHWPPRLSFLDGDLRVDSRLCAVGERRGACVSTRGRALASPASRAICGGSRACLRCIFYLCCWCRSSDSLDETSAGGGPAGGGHQRERAAVGGISADLCGALARAGTGRAAAAAFCVGAHLGGRHGGLFCGPRVGEASAGAAFESEENLGRLRGEFWALCWWQRFSRGG